MKKLLLVSLLAGAVATSAFAAAPTPTGQVLEAALKHNVVLTISAVTGATLATALQTAAANGATVSDLPAERNFVQAKVTLPTRASVYCVMNAAAVSQKTYTPVCGPNKRVVLNLVAALQTCQANG